MSNFVRFLVHAVFVYTCIEGFLVNLTYPNLVPYVVKDAVLVLAYGVLLTEQRPPVGSLRKLGGAVLAFYAVMLFFLLLPTTVSTLSSLVGLKQRLLYIPLMYLGYFYVRTERDMFAFIKLMAWITIPTSVFGIYLFFAGPRALQSLGGSYSAVFEMVNATGSTAWRVPGTFTSPGQYSLFLLMQAGLITGLLFVPNVARGFRRLAIVALVVALAALLASGSRAPFVLYIFTVGAALFYMGRLGRLGAVALAMYGMLALAFLYFGAGVQDRVGSILSQENLNRFRGTAFGQLFYSRMIEAPLGAGLGSATLGGRHFTDFTKLIFVESYLGVLASETGVFGIVVWIWLMTRTVAVIIGGRVLIRRTPTAPLWYFMAFLVLEMIALMPQSTAIDASPGNVYFWFLLGVVVRMADLERIRRAGPHPAPAQAIHPPPPYAFGVAPPARL